MEEFFLVVCVGFIIEPGISSKYPLNFQNCKKRGFAPQRGYK